MRIPKSEFTDADMALCRAHSGTVAHDTHARVMLRYCEPPAAISLTVRAFEVGVHMPSDLPLPPSYWDDLEHWLNTLAPAKPAATGDAYVSAKQPAPAARLASTSSADGAALVGSKLTHSVCIKTHGVWKAGEVTCWQSAKPGAPDNWLPCDKDGWIPHTPTANSVCPVPDDVRFEARYCDGSRVASPEMTRHDCVILWRCGRPSIVAWRPIAKDAS